MKSTQTKQHDSWRYIAIAGGSLAVIVVGVILAVVATRQPTADSGYQPTSERIPQAGTTPQTYGSQPCSGASCPTNQSQGPGVPPTVGSITAVSDKSITLKQPDGTSKTFTVTSSSKIMKAGRQHAYNAGELRVGDTVTVAPAQASSSQVEFVAVDNEGVQDTAQ